MSGSIEDQTKYATILPHIWLKVPCAALSVSGMNAGRGVSQTVHSIRCLSDKYLRRIPFVRPQSPFDTQ